MDGGEQVRTRKSERGRLKEEREQEREKISV